ncbi:MAG TPA: hypothetical protein ENK03_04785 [Candidatus Cloacimonetes bacterium]|nr:hypothetical protein [Candidatus Cloacimonadota bacterium]HHI88223.1 hypothetical protein [Candidatus Cloacimonadota bacterium]
MKVEGLLRQPYQLNKKRIQRYKFARFRFGLDFISDPPAGGEFSMKKERRIVLNYKMAKKFSFL